MKSTEAKLLAEAAVVGRIFGDTFDVLYENGVDKYLRVVVQGRDINEFLQAALRQESAFEDVDVCLWEIRMGNSFHMDVVPDWARTMAESSDMHKEDALWEWLEVVVQDWAS